MKVNVWEWMWVSARAHSLSVWTWIWVWTWVCARSKAWVHESFSWVALITGFCGIARFGLPDVGGADLSVISLNFLYSPRMYSAQPRQIPLLHSLSRTRTNQSPVLSAYRSHTCSRAARTGTNTDANARHDNHEQFNEPHTATTQQNKGDESKRTTYQSREILKQL